VNRSQPAPSPAQRSVQYETLSEGERQAALLGDVRHTLVSLLIGGATWEVAGRALRLSFLPPFSNVLRRALALIASGQILGHLAASLISLSAGFGLAVVGGILLGLIMGRYEWVEYMVGPYVSAVLATPKLAFVPLLWALFGVSRLTQVALVFLNAYFVIVVNTMSGMRSVDGSYVEMARAFGANERQLFWKVLLPGSLPLTMAGLRLGIGSAVKGMISGEMFITVYGLGALLRKYGGRFDSEGVFAVLLVVVAVALLCSSAVAAVERRLTHWIEPQA
jgi:NitT/TauT family transport system permease protein